MIPIGNIIVLLVIGGLVHYMMRHGGGCCGDHDHNENDQHDGGAKHGNRIQS